MGSRCKQIPVPGNSSTATPRQAAQLPRGNAEPRSASVQHSLASFPALPEMTLCKLSVSPAQRDIPRQGTLGYSQECLQQRGEERRLLRATSRCAILCISQWRTRKGAESPQTCTNTRIFLGLCEDDFENAWVTPSEFRSIVREGGSAKPTTDLI